MQQALGYAEILHVPSAFSSNGDAFASHNKLAPATGAETETEFPLESFPTPAELWQRYCFTLEPAEYLTKVGFPETRNYLFHVLGSRAQYADLYPPEIFETR